MIIKNVFVFIMYVLDTTIFISDLIWKSKLESHINLKIMFISFTICVFDLNLSNLYLICVRPG